MCVSRRTLGRKNDVKVEEVSVKLREEKFSSIEGFEVEEKSASQVLCRLTTSVGEGTRGIQPVCIGTYLIRIWNEGGFWEADFF